MTERSDEATVMRLVDQIESSLNGERTIDVVAALSLALAGAIAGESRAVQKRVLDAVAVTAKNWQSLGASLWSS